MKTNLTDEQIDMFAKAKEIQEGWKPEVGDMYIISRDGFAPDIKIVQGWVNSSFNEGRTYLPTTEDQAKMWGDCVEEKEQASRAIDFLAGLYDFLDERKYSKYPEPDEPLQIIALHFIMSDLYNLKWAGEDGWVKG